MTYSVEIAPAAKRQIKKLSKDIQQLVIERLEQLAEIPRPPGVLKMEGEESLYRIRVGDFPSDRYPALLSNAIAFVPQPNSINFGVAA